MSKHIFSEVCGSFFVVFRLVLKQDDLFQVEKALVHQYGPFCFNQGDGLDKVPGCLLDNGLDLFGLNKSDHDLFSQAALR